MTETEKKELEMLRAEKERKRQVALDNLQKARLVDQSEKIKKAWKTRKKNDRLRKTMAA